MQTIDQKQALTLHLLKLPDVGKCTAVMYATVPIRKHCIGGTAQDAGHLLSSSGQKHRDHMYIRRSACLRTADASHTGPLTQTFLSKYTASPPWPWFPSAGSVKPRAEPLGVRGCKELTYTAFCTLLYKGPEHPPVWVPAGVLEPGPTDPKGRLGFEGIKTRM